MFQNLKFKSNGLVLEKNNKLASCGNIKTFYFICESKHVLYYLCQNFNI